MIRDPNTDPMPAPEPATPTVAAPAPMNLAAAIKYDYEDPLELMLSSPESMSLEVWDVWRQRTAATEGWERRINTWRPVLEMAMRAMAAMVRIVLKTGRELLLRIGSLS